ncbi:hypothetical protein UPYG_G00305770 [Umbra pygmaea]|uniref:Uncharacterized protein n=1 Tax=Umbra pygmaea TaxID=75934 RepID=A0ABD0VYS9_UMBPY
MLKVWRQVQENHMEDFYQRNDLYTTLLMALVKPGGIVFALGHGEFQAPPPPRELPCAQLLRHAFLLAEADNVQDYRSQILSTFGTILKMDSTKKASGEEIGWGGQGLGRVVHQHRQRVLPDRVLCPEKLRPMCGGVVERFRLANQPVPKILYINRGCCKAQGPTAVETLFQSWVEDGMVVRLDIFHWVHHFDAALRNAAISKYAAFKSALAGAVLAYNREDLQLLITAVRARDPATMEVVTDEGVVRRYISRDQLKHHVRRLTLGAQETFRLVHRVIEELKGQAGLDESGVSLFKSPAAIDEMWASQQRHLECIQDPPGMAMYRVARTSTINGVDLPYYKGLRRSTSLEGFHKMLPHMIPGPHCATRPYQVYLISGISRWNFDRSSDAVFGGGGRHHRVYSAPLIDRLNSRCQQHMQRTSAVTILCPVFQKLEALCAALVEVGLTDHTLLLNTEQRNRVLDSWNVVEEHDKQPQKYNQLYRTHWGNTLYCRTKRDNHADAALVQRVKMVKRPLAPAETTSILKAYDRIQHRVLVDDPILCKAGIPLPKINLKTVRNFIRQQERLVHLHATRQPAIISKTTSVSSEQLPPATFRK